MRLFRQLFLTTLIALTSASVFAAAGSGLSLDDFLKQVESGNDEYQSHKESAGAGELRSREYKLYNLPNLVAQAETYRDSRLTSNPNIMGTETKMQTYSLGVQQNFGIGLDAKLLYKYVDTTVVGAAPTFMPQPHAITASPVLELNQSLWRNFFGSETLAYKEISSGSAQALQFRETFSQLNVKALAESAYWRLATARKLKAASEDNLERAQRIQAWSARRARLSLTDRSDSLQANAVLASRKIELQTAIDEEQAASRDFNKMRGLDDRQVVEGLQILQPEQIAQLPLPKREGMRNDVKAAEQEARVLKGNAKLSEEATKPDVKLYAQLSLNGRDPNAGDSIDQSFKSDYPMTVVGMKLNMPLSFGIASDARAGYRAQSHSADLAYKRKLFESEKEWQNLSQKFEDSKKRLLLAAEMEKAQKSKMDYERERHARGRTTTYQVILFEQDFASAQVMRINLEREILELYAQLKTFGGLQ